jgi:hypothetical protein
MGEDSTFCATFRPSLRVEVADQALSSFGGVVYLREFEERTRLLAPLIDALQDGRRAERVEHRVSDLLRLAVYGRVLGFPDVADADHLRHDPVLRAVLRPGSQDRVGGLLAAKSTMHRFLTGTLCSRRHRRALAEAVLCTGLAPVLARGVLPSRLYVDLDSTMIEVHGAQQGARNNGYFRAVCYHPLVLSLGEWGTTLGFLLRPGNSHTARHATRFVLPLLRRMREILGPRVEIVLRADSGFADPVLLESLEREGFHYIVRLRENARLLCKAERIAKRRAGRPSETRSVFRRFAFSYRSKGWETSRRVLARAEFEPGTLFPDWTFLCAHLPTKERHRDVSRAYFGRGASEQVNDVFKNELRGDLMSHRRLRRNQVRGLLTALAQNLVVAFDHATAPRRRRRRPATVRSRILLVASALVRHARRLVVRLAAVGARAKTLARTAAAVLALPTPRYPSTA